MCASLCDACARFADNFIFAGFNRVACVAITCKFMLAIDNAGGSQSSEIDKTAVQNERAINNTRLNLRILLVAFH